MCGILAAASAHPGQLATSLFDERWAAALAALVPRGPDGRADHRCPSHLARLGHTRLAIVDLSAAGAQPMTNEDDSLVLSCNGEVYNAPALRTKLESLGHRFRSQCDSEVILHAFEEWGIEKAIDSLRGMFAFILWDVRNQTLHAAVDHAGMKPLCFTHENDHILVASTADAVIELCDNRPALNPTALCHILCHGYSPAPDTIWKSISKLPPGHALRWNARAGFRIWRHWNPPESCAAEPLRDEAEHFESLWHEVVRDHLNADVPLRLLLSAGLDSTAVACAVRNLGASLDCLTLALDGPDSEADIAAQSAAALGFPFHSELLESRDIESAIDDAAAAFDEPQGYGALITMTRVAQAARRFGKVVLTGDGGDEAFAGYIWHAQPPAHATSADTIDPSTLARKLADPASSAALRWSALDSLSSRSFHHAYAQSVAPRMHPAEARALFAPLNPKYDEDIYADPIIRADAPSLPWPRRAQRLDILGFCAGSILPKVDRATMGIGLELRAPFLDRRILDWSLARPVQPNELTGPQKGVIRSYLKHRALPQVLLRPKQGFSLRIPDPTLPDRLLARIRDSALAHSGMMSAHWESFVAPDVPYRGQRIFSLAMIAAWAERRTPCASRS